MGGRAGGPGVRKAHIPRGPLQSWRPSPLASSERERVGCLGVQWGPAQLHVKHPLLSARTRLPRLSASVLGC